MSLGKWWRDDRIETARRILRWRLERLSMQYEEYSSGKERFATTKDCWYILGELSQVRDMINLLERVVVGAPNP